MGVLATGVERPDVVDSEGIDLGAAAASNLDHNVRKKLHGLNCNLHNMGSALLTLPSITSIEICLL